MEYRIITQHDPEGQRMFEAIIRQVFKFSFQPWLDKKLWDDRYRCHCMIDNGQAVSNVAVMEIDVVVQGQTIRMAQLGGVATLEAYQKRGLSRQLMEHVLASYDMPLYLFANDSVLDFYPRFGFQSFEMRQPYLEIAPIEQQGTLQKRTTKGHARLIDHYIHMPRPMSQVLDCVNDSVQWFHCLIDYGDKLYELPGRALVIYERQLDRLMLHDVCGDITWEELYPALPLTGVSEIVFGFEPDRLGVEVQFRHLNEPAFANGWQPPVCCFPRLVET